EIDSAAPVAVAVAEAAVLVTVGMRGLVFLPQQHERHALAAHLSMDGWPVRLRSRFVRGCRQRKEQPLQAGLVEILGQRPGEPGTLGPLEVVADGGVDEPDDTGDLAMAEAVVVPEAQDVSDFAHGYSGRRHRAGGFCVHDTPVVERISSVARQRIGQADLGPRPKLIPSEGWMQSLGTVDGIRRNGGRDASEEWTGSIGRGGRDPSEYAA